MSTVAMMMPTMADNKGGGVRAPKAPPLPTPLICHHGSQKGTKKFVSSKRINLKEYRPLLKKRHGHGSMSSSFKSVLSYMEGFHCSYIYIVCCLYSNNLDVIFN